MPTGSIQALGNEGTKIITSTIIRFLSQLYPRPLALRLLWHLLQLVQQLKVQAGVVVLLDETPEVHFPKRLLLPHQAFLLRPPQLLRVQLPFRIDMLDEVAYGLGYPGQLHALLCFRFTLLVVEVRGPFHNLSLVVAEVWFLRPPALALVMRQAQLFILIWAFCLLYHVLAHSTLLRRLRFSLTRGACLFGHFCLCLNSGLWPWGRLLFEIGIEVEWLV